MNDIPIISDEASRREAIINNDPAIFNIENNPAADSDYGSWRSIPLLGIRAINEYDAYIERESSAKGVDADLVRAIMYVENAQGWHDKVAELFDVETSIKPMNIRYEDWAALGYRRIDLMQPKLNVRAGVELIKRIQDRTETPTPEKIASMYVFLGREKTNDYGARVARVYQDKPWLSDRERAVNQLKNSYEQLKQKYEEIKDQYPNFDAPAQNNMASGSLSNSSGGLLSTVSNFFGGLFGGGSSGTASQFMPRSSSGGFTRASPVDPTSVEQVVGQALEKHADRIVEKIIAQNPNMFQASVGRVLSQSVERFGEALRKGRINDLEDAFSNVFRGKNGEIGLAADIGNQVIGGLLQAGVGELLNKTRTSTFTRESDRSINANNDFRQSRGQQATELIRLLEKGRRNT